MPSSLQVERCKYLELGLFEIEVIELSNVLALACGDETTLIK